MLRLYLIGMAAWTSHAYYTFHHQTGGQRNRTRGGMMDIFRIPRPVYYWYPSELTDEPMVYIADGWREGVERIRIFSNCDEVELLINGVSLGRRRPDADRLKAHLHSPPFTFPVFWEAGEIEARGWQDGKVMATAIARTPEAPIAMDLSVDLQDRTFVADGSDIVLAYARVIDRNGTTVTGFADHVTFKIAGPAEIIGGPEIHSNPAECFDGLAPILVRASQDAGPITLTAMAEGLEQGSVSFESIAAWEATSMTMPSSFIDLPTAKVDLGGVGQHIQFGWSGWDGKDGPASVYVLPGMGEATATVRAADGGTLNWRDESNVPGPLGFVAENGICADGKLMLVFAGLKAGRYRLTTIHHAPQSDTDNMDPLEGKEYGAEILKIPPAVTINVQVTEMDE